MYTFSSIKEKWIFQFHIYLLYSVSKIARILHNTKYIYRNEHLSLFSVPNKMMLVGTFYCSHEVCMGFFDKCHLNTHFLSCWCSLLFPFQYFRTIDAVLSGLSFSIVLLSSMSHSCELMIFLFNISQFLSSFSIKVYFSFTLVIKNRKKNHCCTDYLSLGRCLFTSNIEIMEHVYAFNCMTHDIII